MAHVIDVTSCKRIQFHPDGIKISILDRDSLTHCSQGSVAQLVKQRVVNRRWWVRIPAEPLNFPKIQLVIVSVGYHN